MTANREDRLQLAPGVTLPPGEDALPYDDGEPMESDLHREQIWLLIELLKWFLRARDDAYVAGNMGVYYSELQVKRNDFKAPDVFVALNAEQRARKSWVGWQEGKLPDVVIELLSESTERMDRGDKKRIYAQLWRLPEYYLFDPDTGVLEGYRYQAPGALVPMTAGPDGRLRSEVLGCSFGVWTGRHAGFEAAWMRIWDAAGALVPTGFERAQAEAERAQAEAERAEALAERLRAYEARFGPLDR